MLLEGAVCLGAGLLVLGPGCNMCCLQDLVPDGGVCLWEKARMGSTYDFNSLMYALAIRIGTRGAWDASITLTCHMLTCLCQH